MIYVALHSLIGRLFLKWTLTYIIEHRENKLLPILKLHPYCLMSLVKGKVLFLKWNITGYINHVPWQTPCPVVDGQHKINLLDFRGHLVLSRQFCNNGVYLLILMFCIFWEIGWERKRDIEFEGDGDDLRGLGKVKDIIKIYCMKEFWVYKTMENIGNHEAMVMNNNCQ